MYVHMLNNVVATAHRSPTLATQREKSCTQEHAVWLTTCQVCPSAIFIRSILDNEYYKQPYSAMLSCRLEPL